MERDLSIPIRFLRPKRIELLFRIQNIPNSSIHELHKGICTILSVSNALKEFKQAGLVTIKKVQLKHGTSSQPKLTKKGNKIANKLKEITPYLK